MTVGMLREREKRESAVLNLGQVLHNVPVGAHPLSVCDVFGKLAHWVDTHLPPSSVADLKRCVRVATSTPRDTTCNGAICIPLKKKSAQPSFFMAVANQEVRVRDLGQSDLGQPDRGQSHFGLCVSMCVLFFVWWVLVSRVGAGFLGTLLPRNLPPDRTSRQDSHKNHPSEARAQYRRDTAWNRAAGHNSMRRPTNSLRTDAIPMFFLASFICRTGAGQSKHSDQTRIHFKPCDSNRETDDAVGEKYCRRSPQPRIRMWSKPCPTPKEKLSSNHDKDESLWQNRTNCDISINQTCEVVS